MRSTDDRMPKPFTPDDDALKDRAAKLSQHDLCELVTLSGIIFDSRYSPSSSAYKKEILEISRDTLINVLDEAASRRVVEEYLDSKGV